MADQLPDHLSRARETIRQLELENQLLSDRAEEIFLLGKIAEKANAAENIRDLLSEGLEQIAILKDIPFASFGAWGQGCLDLAYGCLLQGEDIERVEIALDPELLDRARNQVVMLSENECSGVILPPEVQKVIEPTAITMIPAWGEGRVSGCFLFAGRFTPAEQQESVTLMTRAAEILSLRMDNLRVLGALSELNRQLDAKVAERTRQLAAANTEMQMKVVELEAAHRDLQASEQRFRSLVENGFDALFVIDSRLNIVDVNKLACLRLGYERDELLAMSLTGIVPDLDPEVGRAIVAGLQQGRTNARTGSLRPKVDADIPVEIRFGRFGPHDSNLVLAVMCDVSEKMVLEKQLQQAQKMEILGRLSGGIAHDFNNILMAVAGHVDLAAMTLSDEDPLKDDLQAIKAAGERGTRLTRQLLSFSRGQTFQMEPLDLNESVHDLVKVIGRVIGEDIQLVLDLTPDLGFIMADKGLIEQVLMNLVLNARDAMPSGGNIRLATHRVTDGKISQAEVERKDHDTGHFLKVTVADQGQGIAPEALPHIFDPFYTTKEAGKGTGLGLAVVDNICRRHRGWIEVDSTVGQGAVFDLFFPETIGKSSTPDKVSRKGLPRGNERVLLVEDDRAVRDVMTHMLTRLGYDLQVAVDGIEALRLLHDPDGNFAAMISDVIMPGMGGGQLAGEAKRLHPDLKILFMSGYTDDMIVDGIAGKEVAGFLQKPVSYQDLATGLRAAIDR